MSETFANFGRNGEVKEFGVGEGGLEEGVFFDGLAESALDRRVGDGRVSAEDLPLLLGIHLVERNRNVLIANCHLYHNRGAGVFLDRVNLHQTNISGCHISYNVGGGVVVRGGEVRNVHITGCDIEANMSPDSPPAANVWFDCTDGSMAEAAIVGCTIQHESKAAGSANIRIQGRGVFPRKGELIAVNCGHVTIADNVLSDVKTNIELRGARGVTIVGNTFWQGYEHNLFVEDCSHVVVGSNVMERNPLYGYTVEAKNGVVFRGCRDCSINGLHLHNVRECDAGLILDKLVDGVREAYNTPRIRELHAFYGIPNAPVVSLADARRIWDSDSVQWISMSEKLGITLE